MQLCLSAWQHYAGPSAGQGLGAATAAPQVWNKQLWNLGRISSFFLDNYRRHFLISARNLAGILRHSLTNLRLGANAPFLTSSENGIRSRFLLERLLGLARNFMRPWGIALQARRVGKWQLGRSSGLIMLKGTVS